MIYNDDKKKKKKQKNKTKTKKKQKQKQNKKKITPILISIRDQQCNYVYQGLPPLWTQMIEVKEPTYTIEHYLTDFPSETVAVCDLIVRENQIRRGILKIFG